MELDLRKQSIDDVMALRDQCDKKITTLVNRVESEIKGIVRPNLRQGRTFNLESMYRGEVFQRCTITSRRKMTLRYSYLYRRAERKGEIVLSGDYPGIKFLMRITSIKDKNGKIIYRRSDLFRKMGALKYMQRMTRR